LLKYFDNHLYCCFTLNKSITNVCFLSSIYLFNQTSIMIILIPKKEFSLFLLFGHRHRLRKRTFAIVAAQSSRSSSIYACLTILCRRLNEEIVCEGWPKRRAEKNGEEVIKPSLIYRTCDYVRQSSYVIDWPTCLSSIPRKNNERMN